MTSNIHAHKQRTVSSSWRRAVTQSLKRDWQLYVLLLLPIVFVVLFKYAAYPGLRIAFMNFKPAKGFAGSEWVGLGIFQKIFRDADFIRALKNSLVFNFLDLAVGFPVPIILAILLNELRFHRFKRISQTVLYLPHFLSWVIVASVAYTMFKPETGLVNIALKQGGFIQEGIPFISEKWHWAVTYLLVAVWQGMGWGTIIYLAAITGINGELYEAATIDGASRLRKIWHVTMPGIRATTVTLLILNLAHHGLQLRAVEHLRQRAGEGFSVPIGYLHLRKRAGVGEFLQRHRRGAVPVAAGVHPGADRR
jgi:putative aldouronate transport system permease protein